MEDKDLRSSLGKCSSRQEIEDVFKRLNIVTIEERESALDKIMGNPETFYSSEISNKDLQYQRKVSIFLTGAWKINDFYERAGL